MDALSNTQVEQAGLTDWRKLAQALHGRFVHPDLGARAAFVAGLAATTEIAVRMPEVRLFGEAVDVVVATHEHGVWVTDADLATARQVSELAVRHGLRADPGNVVQLELGLDTAREDALGRFWSALLTGAETNKIHDSVLDPTARVPYVWFQESEQIDAPAQRWHPDLWLAPETAGPRIEAAVAAGGAVVDDSGAPRFTVLADPDGNRVCVCTSLGR